MTVRKGNSSELGKNKGRADKLLNVQGHCDLSQTSGLGRTKIIWSGLSSEEEL